MQKKIKIDDYIIEMITLNYHHEWLVYFENKKEQGVYYKTFKEAILAVADKINEAFALNFGDAVGKDHLFNSVDVTKGSRTDDGDAVGHGDNRFAANVVILQHAVLDDVILKAPS